MGTCLGTHLTSSFCVFLLFLAHLWSENGLLIVLRASGHSQFEKSTEHLRASSLLVPISDGHPSLPEHVHETLR